MRAVLVDDVHRDATIPAGAIEFRELDGVVMGIAFRCPCGCGFESWLPIRDDHTGWQWDGNREAPSLTPSVLQSGLPCKWHGYLTNGEWRVC
ncbi:MAG: hypothetical protein K2P68_01330 [Sphingomonas sp.]|nr:hypothetical protein [Sphingomonas sp.]